MYLVYCGALSGRRLLISTQLESHNNLISHGPVFIIVLIIILLLPHPSCVCCEHVLLCECAHVPSIDIGCSILSLHTLVFETESLPEFETY